MQPDTMIEHTLSKLMDFAIERDRIEHEMGKLHLAARGLLNLVDDKPRRTALRLMLDNYGVRIGLTDLIKLALTMSEKPMTPVEIRNFIINFGSEASQQQNLLQSVHTMLRRMDGEIIRECENEVGDKAYRLATLAETLVRSGVEPKAAEKVGGQIENKFDSSKLWGEAFKDEEWMSHSLAALGVPEIYNEGIQVRTKPRRLLGTPPTRSASNSPEESMAECMVRIAKQKREQPKKK